MSAQAPSCVLTLACPDRVGIVAAVSEFIAARHATIVESQQFSDRDSGTFFMRVRFADSDGRSLDIPNLSERFGTVAGCRAGDGEMTWRMVDAARPQRVIIMVSREAHCLIDLLYRNSVAELNLDVVAVVSNHPDLAHVADAYDVPFRHVPVSAETKAEAEAALLEIVETEHVELVILARYMQILSGQLCDRLAGRAINIHHSMLPSFKGARPYHQAYARGVKVIGATAHYVTADLDEGPIIDQEIGRVDHAMTADDFAASGRSVEARALSRAVRLHSENRVALNGQRTVVLR